MPYVEGPPLTRKEFARMVKEGWRPRLVDRRGKPVQVTFTGIGWVAGPSPGHAEWWATVRVRDGLVMSIIQRNE